MSYNRWITPSDELYHYGVLGMKWGVHKARSARRAIDRADREMDKATTKESSAAAVKGLNRALDRHNSAQKSLAFKSQNKLAKLDRKYQKKQAKADRMFDKAERKANSLLASKRSADKAFRKASKYQFKANKAAARGKKWYDRMVKEYKKADIAMTKESQSIGEEFIRQVRANSRAMYAASYAGGR